MSDTTLKALEATTGGTELGAVSVMQSTTPVKVPKSTIVKQSGVEVEFATEAGLTAVKDAIGTDGNEAPANGSGVRGWLRDIKALLAGTLKTVVDITKVNGAEHAAGNPLFADIVDRANRTLGVISGAVMADQGSAGAQPWPVSGPMTNQEARQTPLAIAISGVGAAAATPAFAIAPPVTPITATGAAAAALTLTIPAPAAGLSIYLVGYELLLVNTAARAIGTATLITVSTTNLGSLSWSFGSPVSAIGSSDRSVAMRLPAPIKAAAPATACTIVGPATTGVLWMFKAFYYVAP